MMSVLPNLSLVADSLGWAVLHSFWQGLLAASIVFIVRSSTRERASDARYFVGIITLCALLCAFIGTFLYYYNSGAAAMSLSIGQEKIINLAMPIVVDVAPTNPLLRLGDFTGLIGVFWTVCFAVLGVRYLAAFRLTHKLRNHGLSNLSADCQARFRTLVKASGVSPRVRVYFSKHVSSPITFGFLKPIILVPTWFFTGMTSEQCEAVLLHELAHIRRHDYLTNILQIAIKIVFFYHPAVQFICKGLDVDREHACDDFAVMLTKKPEELATALGTIRLKAARDGGVFALSAEGRDAPLMHRLKRLMGTPSRNMHKSITRGIAATAMMGSALALVITLGATASQAHAPRQQAQDIELAGVCITCGTLPDDTKRLEKEYDRSLEFGGETYTAGTDEINVLNDITTSSDGTGNTYHIIKGKKYPSKYAYSLFSKDGETYVVKQKNGKRYMEIGDNWYLVDDRKTAGSFAVPTPSTPGAPGTNNYLPSNEVLAGAKAQLERASDRREAALERAEEMRERQMERAEEQREQALERAQEVREKAMERNEIRFAETRTRTEERIARNIERQIAKIEHKIARKARDLAKVEVNRLGNIGRLERDIAKKQADIERKLNNNPNISQSELGRMQGEIGRLQGKIGRIQGMNGSDQGEIGRLQGEMGRLQGEIGRTQGQIGRKQASVQQSKYYAMRDRLIPQLKADGYMKSDRSEVTIRMTPTDIFINEKKLANAKEGKYCDIISDYLSSKSDVKKIVIKPGYLHVSQKGDGQNNSFTFNAN